MFTLIKWVAVKDRLPDNDGWFDTMVMYEDGSTRFVELEYSVNYGEFYPIDCDPDIICDMIGIKVTHWAEKILDLKEESSLLLEHWKRTQTATLKGYLRRLSGYVKEDKRLDDMEATVVRGKIQTMIRRLDEAEARRK